MRHRGALLSVVALSLLGVGVGVGACGGDKPDAPAAQPPAATVPAVPPGSPASGASGTGTSAVGTSAGAAPAGGTPAAGRPGGDTPGGGTPAAPPGGAPVKPGGAPANAAAQLTAAGFGPYRVAAKRTALTSAGVLGKVDTSKKCTGFVVVRGVRKYHTPTLVFHRGALQYTTVTSSAVATPAGARVGMSYAEVKNRHAGGKELTDWLGTPAWFVTSGKNALLFRLKNDTVHSIEAGVAEPLQFRYTDGQGC